MNIDYDLIGSVPMVERYRDTLDSLIAEYEADSHKAPQRQAELLRIKEEGGIEALNAHVASLLNDESVLRRISIGATIELCAQHFYGINTSEVGSIAEVIALIKAADNELEFGK